MPDPEEVVKKELLIIIDEFSKFDKSALYAMQEIINEHDKAVVVWHTAEIDQDKLKERMERVINDIDDAKSTRGFADPVDDYHDSLYGIMTSINCDREHLFEYYCRQDLWDFYDIEANRLNQEQKIKVQLIFCLAIVYNRTRYHQRSSISKSGFLARIGRRRRKGK